MCSELSTKNQVCILCNVMHYITELFKWAQVAEYLGKAVKEPLHVISDYFL